VTIFKRHRFNGHNTVNNSITAGDDDITNDNSELKSNESLLKNLAIGQEIIVKIKSIQYEQNDLFIIATFEKKVSL
jgi:hypothetical protein